MDRRNFLTTTALGSLALGLEAQEIKKKDGRPAEVKHEASPIGGPPAKPIIISAANGWNGSDKGYQILLDGGDTLDAAIAIGKTQEDDPNDSSVGLGGLPNEEGVVELDSCCMHGPTRRCGSVGGEHWTKNASLLAKAVMSDTGHVMLVAEGADRFAKAAGFPKDELLTESSRKVWFLWKQYNSSADWWGPGMLDPDFEWPSGQSQAELFEQKVKRLEAMAADIGIPPEQRLDAIHKVMFPPHGTIHVSALNPKGEISGMTTTSGLAWKIPGRVGDSPIIGAGCYTDPDVGSAGATGSGEENIRVAGAHSIIENMRHGMSPKDAAMDVLRRIANNFHNDMHKLKYVSMTYYALRKDGVYAGCSLWSGPPNRHTKFCVNDGTKRLEDTAALFEGVGAEYPPLPEMLRQKWNELRQQQRQRR